MVVVDASVAVKWFVVEEFYDEAKRLLDEDEPLLAPRLIEVEVASAILARARRGEMPADHAQKLVKHWLEDLVDSTAFHLVENRALIRDAAQLACKLDHKLADCLYIVLARDAGAALATADIQMARKAGSLPGLEVRLLGAD